jgi:hypothetical protein
MKPGRIKKADIEKIAGDILTYDPDSPVKVRLLRDLLLLPPNDKELKQARRALDKSPHVVALKNSQRPDGGWGRFHSADSRIKSKIPTTEMAVLRTLALGLDKDHPIVRKAVRYLEKLLDGKIAFPDPAEKNNRWPTGCGLFVSSTLARIDPANKRLDLFWILWHDILKRTFATGQYSAASETAAHRELTGADTAGSYLALNGKYQLRLLGSRPRLIDSKIAASYIDWVWNHPEGIGYLGQPLSIFPPKFKGYGADAWFCSMQILSRFGAWRKQAVQSMEWLWHQRDNTGFWDFGPNVRYIGSHFMPLLDDWRAKKNRAIDWSTRVLVLLKRFAV